MYVYSHTRDNAFFERKHSEHGLECTSGRDQMSGLPFGRHDGALLEALVVPGTRNATNEFTLVGLQYSY